MEERMSAAEEDTASVRGAAFDTGTRSLRDSKVVVADDEAADDEVAADDDVAADEELPRSLTLTLDTDDPVTGCAGGMGGMTQACAGGEGWLLASI